MIRSIFTCINLRIIYSYISVISKSIVISPLIVFSIPLACSFSIFVHICFCSEITIHDSEKHFSNFIENCIQSHISRNYITISDFCSCSTICIPSDEFIVSFCGCILSEIYGSSADDVNTSCGSSSSVRIEGYCELLWSILETTD